MTREEHCEDWYDVPSDEMTLEQARQAVNDLRKKLVEYLEKEPCDEYGNYRYPSDIELTEPNTATSIPCDDAISRQAVIDEIEDDNRNGHYSCFASNNDAQCFKDVIHELPSVNPQEPQTGHCKDCKYFEYDSVAKVDGIPLIVAHEICSRWGDGCKTKEDGYCFLYEPQESEKE